MDGTAVPTSKTSCELQTRVANVQFKNCYFSIVLPLLLSLCNAKSNQWTLATGPLGVNIQQHSKRAICFLNGRKYPPKKLFITYIKKCVVRKRELRGKKKINSNELYTSCIRSVYLCIVNVFIILLPVCCFHTYNKIILWREGQIKQSTLHLLNTFWFLAVVLIVLKARMVPVFPFALI